MLSSDLHPWIVSSLNEEGKEQSISAPNAKFPTRLILHFDINETILLGDDAGGDSRHDSVQKMLAKSAFCQMPKSNKKSCTSWQDTTQLEPSHWWDGQEMGKENSIPPLYTGWTWPENCCPYYRTKFKNLAKTFVERHHGTIYRPILEKCEEELAKSSSNNILPAFYHTLNHLICQQKTEQHPFTLVFRTFGSDVREMAKLVTEFAQGKHPDYPDVNYPPLELFPDRLYQGRWEKMQNGLPVYQLWNEDETKLVASGDAEILKLLEQVSVCGIRDDYPFWKDNGWNPMAGKPVWIPSYNVHQEKYIGCYDHHLLFDDNIHNLRHDVSSMSVSRLSFLL